MLNQPHTIFNNREAAEKIVIGWDASEYRIIEEPKGSGRCLIMTIDDATGDEMGYL